MRFVIACLLLVLTGCASRPSVEAPGVRLSEGASHPAPVEPEARTLYAQADKAFEAKNFDAAQRLFQQIKIKFPRGKAQVFSSYRLGIIHYYRENYAAAAKEFEYFVTRMPSSDLAFDATYNWAACEHQLSRNDRAYQILARLKRGEVQSQGPKRAETVYQLTARVAAALGNHATAIGAYALQLQLPLEDAVRTSVEGLVDEQLAFVSTREKLQSLLLEVNEPTVRQKIDVKISELNSALNSPTPTSSGLPVPPAVVAAIGNADAVEPSVPLPSGGTSGVPANIGVILPLTGKWSSYGNRALDGILLAAGLYSEDDDSRFKIFIKDSGSSPVAAQNAFDELAGRDRVMAVIGPIASKEAGAVAERSQSIGVPNISLSTKEGISAKNPYVFQTGLTPTVQLENLVSYAIEGRAFKRFAILAPNNPFGRDMAQGFWEQVTGKGGTVSSYQLYPPQETDFQEQVQSMVGLKDLRFRRLEVAKMTEYIRDIKAKTGKEPKVQLPPLIDFDAIFIPDSPKAVSQIAASLNYYDVNKVPLLGTSEWNSEIFFRRGAALVQTAIFPAGLYLASNRPATKRFSKSYQDAYRQTPDLLAAQSFEAMQIIIRALQDVRSDSRNDLANAIARIRDFESPLGTLSFDNQRIGRRKMAVLALENGVGLSEH